MDIITPTAESGRVYINKLSAAERQLSSAIRMYFLEEDVLAIHTVASAAWNLYTDLLRRRGKDPAAYDRVYGILRTARDHIEGVLSKEDLENLGPESLQQLTPYIDFLNENPDLNLDEIRVSGRSDLVRKFWNEKRKSYNFLKHADRDHAKLLDQSEVNNEDLILRAIVSSLHLNCQFTAEKEFFWSAMYAFEKLDNPPAEPSLIWVLKGHSSEEIMVLARRNLCYTRFNDGFDIDFDAASDRTEQLYAESHGDK